MAVFPPATTVLAETRRDPVTAEGRRWLAGELLAEQRFVADGVASIGVRSNLVYGPGRTDEATAAIAASADDQPYALRHQGAADFQFVGDVAAALIAASESIASP